MENKMDQLSYDYYIVSFSGKYRQPVHTESCPAENKLNQAFF